METAFRLLATPRVFQLPGFRFAFHRVRGPYAPWTRIQALDAVAETLEKHALPRIGPPFGIYYDLPFPLDDMPEWTCDLGHPVADEAPVPRTLGLRDRMLPKLHVAGLRYRGDLMSFEPALQLLVEWILSRGLEPRGPLLERFHLSDPLTGVEEREIFVALEPLTA